LGQGQKRIQKGVGSSWVALHVKIIQHVLPSAASCYAFLQVHQETFGKSGCRRLVPGQLLTVDPKGRACMIAALEKQKFVYVLNRDNAANLTISSPLEAHKSHNIVFNIVGLDCGFDNPIFAAIELDYSEADQVSQVQQLCLRNDGSVQGQLDTGYNM
jgi:splicing factor 3B subunit 3